MKDPDGAERSRCRQENTKRKTGGRDQWHRVNLHCEVPATKNVFCIQQIFVKKTENEQYWSNKKRGNSLIQNQAITFEPLRATAFTQ